MNTCTKLYALGSRQEHVDAYENTRDMPAIRAINFAALLKAQRLCRILAR